MEHKTGFIKIGDFFFKWRNIVFPVIILLLFFSFPPPTDYFGRQWLKSVKDILALVITLSGLGFRAVTVGWAYIQRGGRNKQVYADKLVSRGLFKLCRNPLYVGNLLIFIGLFILHGHPVVMVVGIGLYYFVYESIIAAEEYFLKQKFKEEYHIYCAQTRRWLPNFSKYQEATKDMTFSYRRVLAKDYTTVFSTLFTVIAVKLIEHYYAYSAIEYNKSLRDAGIAIVVLLIFVSVTKYLKKNGKLDDLNI